jgi:hypothetical protein
VNFRLPVCLTLCEFVNETAARMTYHDRDGTMPGHFWRSRA